MRRLEPLTCGGDDVRQVGQLLDLDDAVVDGRLHQLRDGVGDQHRDLRAEQWDAHSLL